MEIRVLGCSGGIGGPANRTTALLVDEDILIDCGTGVAELSFEQLLKIDHVFLTHSHLDHIAYLPLLIDTVAEFRAHALQLHASVETLEILRRHIFNWQIWPDFTELPDAAAPALVMHPLDPQIPFESAGRFIRALPAQHVVPAVGYEIRAAQGGLVFTGDTTLCDALVGALNGLEDLRYLLIEAAFPNDQYALAVVAQHLCPDMLRQMLAQLRVTPEVFVTHLKPGMNARIIDELTGDFGRFRPRALEAGTVFVL